VWDKPGILTRNAVGVLIPMGKIVVRPGLISGDKLSVLDFHYFSTLYKGLIRL
jgi:hypothetical protein